MDVSATSRLQPGCYEMNLLSNSPEFTKFRSIQFFRLLSATFCLGFLCGTSPLLQAQQSEDETSGRLDLILNDIFTLQMSPGMSVAVVRNGSVIYARGFGYADLENKRPVSPNTQFYIASTTKSLTAFALALLAENGQLDLNAPVARYLPQLKLHEGLDPAQITIEQLLTHTHGIDGDGPVTFRTAYSGDFTREELPSLLVYHAPSASGTNFDYSNIGYNVAGFVIEAVAGKSWKDVVNERILSRMGMKHTSAYASHLDVSNLALPYESTPDGFKLSSTLKADATMHAAGGHYSSIDMAAWIGVQMGEGEWNGRQVFPAKVIRNVQEKHAEQDRKFGEIQRHGWGLGWDLGTYKGDALVHRFGTYTGFRSHVSFMPGRETGVVVLVNDSMIGSFLADAAAFLIYDELSQKGGAEEIRKQTMDKLTQRVPALRQRLATELKKRAVKPQTLPHSLASYSGTYTSKAYGTIACTAEDDRLVFTIGALESAATVHNNTKNQFRVELAGSGSIATFTMHEGMGQTLTISEMEFERVR
jgi:CubicO group peptidase (beta-lactamase class C family)